MRAALCKASPTPLPTSDWGIKDHRVCHQKRMRDRQGQWEPRPTGAGSKARAQKVSGRGAFNYCPQPQSRGSRGEESFEGRRAPSRRGACVHRRRQFPTNSRLSFPSLFSLLFLGPPHARQDSQAPQRSPSPGRESSKGLLGDPREGTRDPLEGPGAGGAPVPQQPEGLPEAVGDPPWPWSRRAQRFFLFFASLPGREGGDFKFTSGRAPWGSGSNLSTGCLSSAAEKSIAQGPGLSRRWIKLQTPTPLLLHSGQSEPILQRGL